MKIYNKICKFVLLGLGIINIILSFVPFGRVDWYKNSYDFFYGKKDGVYTAHLYENNFLGTMFFIFNILIVVALVVIIILNYAKKKEIQILDLIINFVTVLTGLFGIIAPFTAKEYIVSKIDGFEAAGGRIAVSQFTSSGVASLDTILYLSIFMIQLAVVAIVFTFILKSKQKSE